MNKRGVYYALLSALLFGGGNRFAKIFLDDFSPILLAGLFYAGSGLGLFLIILVRKLLSQIAQRKEQFLNYSTKKNRLIR